jgi:hypothetical protein
VTRDSPSGSTRATRCSSTCCTWPAANATTFLLPALGLLVVEWPGAVLCKGAWTTEHHRRRLRTAALV